MTLAGVLAVIGLLAIITRRFGGKLSQQFLNTPKKRLELLDTLSIDAKRQVILIRKDNKEHLILTGGSQELLLDSQEIQSPAQQQVFNFPEGGRIPPRL
jgi:flagellar protein FliO/FliZ